MATNEELEQRIEMLEGELEELKEVVEQLQADVKKPPQMIRPPADKPSH